MPTAKPKFRSAYSDQLKITCPAGNRIEKEYGYKVSKSGAKELVQTGERNIWEEIQMYLEETKIENILKRVAAGDTSDFRPDGIYEDMTMIPNNMIDAMKEMQRLNDLWNGMDSDIKAKYNWNLDEFMADAGKAQWLIDAGFMTPVEEPTETPAKEKAETTSKEVSE